MPIHHEWDWNEIAANLRRNRTPAITSTACAAQYFIESISGTLLTAIPASPANQTDHTLSSRDRGS
jgi:hypothetical protein